MLPPLIYLGYDLCITIISQKEKICKKVVDFRQETLYNIKVCIWRWSKMWLQI